MGIYRYLNTSKNYLGLRSACPAPAPAGSGPGSIAGGRKQQGPEPLRLGPPFFPPSWLAAGRGEQD